jgi:hypothetical protein
MDDQITQLDRRLSTVERDVAVLAADAASARPHYATKEDIGDLKLYLAKLEVRMMRWTAGIVVAACSVMTAILKIWL